MLAQNEYVFLKRDGTGPRLDIAYCVKSTLQECIITKVTPHVFRAIQARAHLVRV